MERENNQCNFHKSFLTTIVKTLFEAILLVIIVVYVFLQDLRSTLIPLVGIVVSLVGTFAFMAIAGFSVNLITLFALVLVIGTVVDDSIVVVEAVQARFDEGYRSPYKASVDAVKVISNAVITSSLVFMAVLLAVPIGLLGSFLFAKLIGQMIINPGKLIANAIGSLTIPLFSRGRNKANLDIAKAQQQEATLAFEQTLLNAGKEVNDAMTQYQTAINKSQLFKSQVEASERAYRSTKLLMTHGPTTYFEVLTAQQAYLTAQLQQTANKFNEIQGVINIYHALGGGQ